MGTKRRKIQMELAFMSEGRGEAPMAGSKGTEVPMAKRESEDPALAVLLMEQICQRENLIKALQRVRQNKGGPGIDGMTVNKLPGYLKKHWPQIREQLLAGAYSPRPVKRVEIPKSDGGIRKLGIPTVLDRFIQQAIMQVLQTYWDKTFSDHSYGFRPGRSAHQAISRGQQYVDQGYRWIVDIDLEKFFDRVNHDKLMGNLAKRIDDKRLLRVIRAFLNAGVMADGLVSSTTEGTPQGGPLSPLLSNIVLDELDRELERRGHRFVRYADDCNIYVRSERAGQRVMASVSKFITRKLKLKVNQSKSKIDRPWRCRFLGFRIIAGKQTKRSIAPSSLRRFKQRVRKLTCYRRAVTIEQMIKQLNGYLIGWRGYFGYCQSRSILQVLDCWIRRRLRCVYWRRWKRGKRRFAELRQLDIGKDLAARAAGSVHGPWRVSRSPALSYAFPNAHFDSLGLALLAK
ncbi:MAG: group II intron reverse transcriptase/maturase [Planctomycetota bacterium]|jgi:RNA-directed DNA polymerase